jgi:hypothetical protein
VVHGIHLLLWALDSLAAAQPGLPPLRSIRAQFNKFVYLNEPADVVMLEQKPAAGTNAIRARTESRRGVPLRLESDVKFI